MELTRQVKTEARQLMIVYIREEGWNGVWQGWRSTEGGYCIKKITKNLLYCLLYVKMKDCNTNAVEMYI